MSDRTCSNWPMSNHAPCSKEQAFYAYPLRQAMQLDGYASDWESLLPNRRHYGVEATQEQNAIGTDASLSFDLLLGVREQQLHGYISVRDDTLVYRHPGYRRLNNSDHLRISYRDSDGKQRRILLLTAGPGHMSAYQVDRDWKYAVDGQPLRRVAAYWQPTNSGYDIELRLPLALLGPERRLHLALADVDDEQRRATSQVLGTLDIRRDQDLNLVVLRSAELERILASLERANARIWIVDRYRRVRAQVGQLGQYGVQDFARETATRNEASVNDALQGNAGLQRRTTLDGQGEIIMATHPIYAGSETIGAVVVEQSTADILALQRGTLERIGIATLVVLLVIIASLLLFSSRLAYRIRRLSKEAHGAIDEHGRLHSTQLRSDRRAGDEFGELSRSFSGLLRRLSRYTRFLEQMPRLLRHEINNPLNAISTSLQNLANSEVDQQPQYLASAQRGVERIGAIVQALTEAASLEQALRSEERQLVQLDALLHHYRDSCAIQHPQRRFDLHIGGGDFQAEINDFRIEQLLDKLIDNAVDFSAEDAAIELTLTRNGEWIALSVSNPGTPLAPEATEQIFDSMVSRREAGTAEPHAHLGMGLYVVRLIAEHHGGRVEANNRPDGNGVTVTVSLPALPQ